MVLGDVQNQFKQRGINAMCKAVKVWLEHHSHCSRSVEGSFSWLQSQLEGGFLKHLGEIMKSLSQEDVLRWMGFSLPSDSAVGDPDFCHEGQAGDEDKLACDLARLGFLLCGLRQQRCMFMIQGYSCRSIRWLCADPAVVTRELEAFKRAYQLLRELETLAADVGSLKTYVERSQFRMLPVQQLVQAAESCNWSPGLSEQVTTFLKSKHKRLMGTQIVEDCFMRQQREKYGHFTRRVRVGSA